MHKAYLVLIFMYFCQYGYAQCAPDTTPPEITCPANIIVDCFYNVGDITPTASDSCGAIISQTYTLSGATVGSSPATGINDATGTLFQSGITTVTYTVKDTAGNAASCAFTVTITDIAPPIVECPVNVTYPNDEGFCYAVINNDSENPKQLGFPIVFDPCFFIINSSGIPPNDEYPVGTTIITWTITDGSGLSTQCEQEVTVTDAQAPDISCPADITVNVDPGLCSATVTMTAFPSAIDNCIGDITITNNYNGGGADASGIYPSGITEVIFTATDSSGASASCTMLVTVNNESPVISLNGVTSIELEACGTYIEAGATAIDNCGNTTVLDNSNITSTPVLDMTVPGVYTIRYNFPNATEVTRTVTVVDTTAPILSLEGENPQFVGDCSTYSPLGVTIDDGCVVNTNAVVVSGDVVDTNTTGTYNVIYNFTDDAGNAATSISRTVEVINVTGPEVTLLGDNPQTIEACSEYTELGATALDPCTFVSYNDNISVFFPPEFDLSTPGTYDIIYTATDDETEPNEGPEVIRTIIVEDTTSPEFVCPEDILVSNDLGSCAAIVTFLDPIVNDCSSFTLAQTEGPVSGSDFPLGDTTITFEATDAFGNSNNCSFTVTVNDTEAPVFNLPADINKDTDLGLCSAIVDYNMPTATDNCSSSVTIVQTAGLASGSVFPVGITLNTFEFMDEAGNMSTDSFEVIITDATLPAFAGNDYTSIDCTNNTVTLEGSIPAATGIGAWTIVSGQTSGFSFSDINDPNAIFSGDVGETYILNWQITFTEGCATSEDQVSITISGCDALDFDGVDDNVSFGDNFNFSGAFSLEIWVKPETNSANVQTLLSKRETNNQTDGYDLRLVNNVVSFNWNNGQSISTAPHTLNQNNWHHVAVTFDGSLYTLYVDGIPFSSNAGLAPTSNTVDFILGAMEETINTPTGQDLHFDGGLDELRVWNTALTVDQIRQMMNQELMDDAGILKGKTTGLLIPGLSWSDLNGYYQMNQITDINLGNLTPSNGTTVEGVLRFMDSFQDETAPLPYQSQGDGLWTETSSWRYGNVRNIPNGFGIDGTTAIDWNIVTINHNIEVLDRDINLSSLIVENNTLSIANSDPDDGQYIRIHNYLKLKSTTAQLRLVGESQLLQDENSSVDYTGLGQLERHQQGTANLFNYNYWSSPVSSNGIDFQIGTVLYDQGQNVQWTNSFDSDASTTPITLSRRWLYLYENYPEDDYASWNAIDENTSVDVGLGYLAKGSGTAETQQNYGFKGKPNNGIIQLPITSGNQALVGNPYPSAIDAHQFIDDNNGSIYGALYFWVHYDTNSTHILRDYQGGYSTYTKAGGNPAVSPPEISQDGSSSKIPERYIPVAQGFFVGSSSSGGDVTFNNGQRVFKKEGATGVADDGSVFMRNLTASNPSAQRNNPIQRMRFNFYGTEGAKRPLLLAFTPDNVASEGLDYGWDALNTETLPSDASWRIEGQPHVIQGTAAFDDSQMYPLMVTASEAGTVAFELSALENFESSVAIYLYDSVLKQTFQINDSKHEVYLEAGNYIDRFAIVFNPNSSLSLNDEYSDFASVRYLMNSKEIYIELNPAIRPNFGTLFNTLGQSVKSWKANALQNANGIIRLNVNDLSEGLYIFELKTPAQRLSTKLLFTNPK